MAIPNIPYLEVFHAIHHEYMQDFKNTFRITHNATIQCCNLDIQSFNTFIAKWTGYFRDNEILLVQLVLVPSRGKGDIETVNANKMKILQLYGVAYHLYLKSCRFLAFQPDAMYGPVVLIRTEV